MQTHHFQLLWVKFSGVMHHVFLFVFQSGGLSWWRHPTGLIWIPMKISVICIWQSGLSTRLYILLLLMMKAEGRPILERLESCQQITHRKTKIPGVMLKRRKEYPLPTPYYHFFLQMKTFWVKPSQTALKNSLRLGKLAFVLCFVRFLPQAHTLHFNSIKPNAKHKHTYTLKRKRPKTKTNLQRQIQIPTFPTISRRCPYILCNFPSWQGAEIQYLETNINRYISNALHQQEAMIFSLGFSFNRWYGDAGDKFLDFFALSWNSTANNIASWWCWLVGGEIGGADTHFLVSEPQERPT